MYDDVRRQYVLSCRKERDSESGLDMFGARYYGSSLGRFMSVDPVIITPERKLDPQQLNRYAYLRNNPLRFIDPTGEILQLSGDLAADKAAICDIVDRWPRSRRPCETWDFKILMSMGVP